MNEVITSISLASWSPLRKIYTDESETNEYIIFQMNSMLHRIMISLFPIIPVEHFNGIIEQNARTFYETNAIDLF